MQTNRRSMFLAAGFALLSCNLIQAAPVIQGEISAASVPVVDGIAFNDDFSTGNLSKWGTVSGSPLPAIDATGGNPDQSVIISTGTSQESFLRAAFTNSSTTYGVSFDVRVNSSTGHDFQLMFMRNAGFATNAGINIKVGTNDYVTNFNGTDAYGDSITNQDVYDIRIGDADGNNQGLTLRLLADDYYRYTFVDDTGTTNDRLYITKLSTGDALEITVKSLGQVESMQIGDTSVGAQWGDVNWDNFAVGNLVPEPASAMLLALGLGALMPRRRVKQSS